MSFANELLVARRDLKSAREAKGWIPSFMMTMGINQSTQGQKGTSGVDLGKLDGDLAVAAIWGFALEAFVAKLEGLDELVDAQNLWTYLSDQKYDEALGLVHETIHQKKLQSNEGEDEKFLKEAGRLLCTVYIEILVMKKAAEVLPQHNEDQ